MIKRNFLAACLVFSAATAVGTATAGAETLAIAAAEETQTCPACGYENKAGLNYCVKCGSSLKEEAPGEKITCPQCDEANPKTAKFCTACGYPLQVKKPEAGAASAPGPKKGVYFTGGLASYGGIELINNRENRRDDMGTSWAIGGGFILPVWSSPGVVQLSLELSTDAGFSMIDNDFENQLNGDNFKTSLIPIRETAILGVGFGPRKMIKPFCGFGGGAGILIWEYKTFFHEEVYSTGTAVKPVFDIPFGCEFRLTPNFALGVKADYLVIPGDIEMKWEPDWYDTVNASVPDVFLFGGAARFCF